MTRTAILIPGQAPVHQSLLAFAEEAIDRRGGTVRRICWSPPADLELAELADWVREQVSAVLPEMDHKPVLVGKSLGSLAAPLAAEHGLSAIWFTPVLHEPRFVSLYEKATAPRLFVGGTADPLWDGRIARQLSPHVCEVDGADHGLFVVDRPLAESGRAHGKAGTAIEHFLDEAVWR